MMLQLPRLLLAAPSSGSGKTTLVCGLLQLCIDRQLRPAACKCGPDYIDPQFHRKVVGAQSGNLDLFFTDEPTVRALLAKHSQGCDIALMEGVMGYYDGLAADSPQASSYHLAQATQTPVVLVLNPRGASLSLAATLHGFATFRPDANIQGVILNNCSQTLYQYLKPGLEQVGIPLLGYLPPDERFRLASRHLGLVTADEVTGLRDMLSQLSQTLARTLNVERLWQIAQSAPPLEYQPYQAQPLTAARPRLAVAQDQAFCFYYRENLDMLRELGAELVEFSPLSSAHLPPNLHGLYFGGGYPELYGELLAANQTLQAEIRAAVAAGLPLVAECGGFLYLQEALLDDNGQRWPMLGLLPGCSQNVGRLKQFGYATVTACRDNLYCRAGESIRAHEFHYWHSDTPGADFAAEKPNRQRSWPCMVANERLVAGFPHLYYPANPHFAANFIRAITCYKESLS